MRTCNRTGNSNAIYQIGIIVHANNNVNSVIHLTLHKFYIFNMQDRIMHALRLSIHTVRSILLCVYVVFVVVILVWAFCSCISVLCVIVIKTWIERNDLLVELDSIKQWFGMIKHSV